MKAIFTSFSFTSLMIFGLITSDQAQAGYFPGWDRPIQEAEMTITTLRGGGFQGVTDVVLTATRKDEISSEGYSGFTLSYLQLMAMAGLDYFEMGSDPGNPIKRTEIKLDVSSKTFDGCHSAHYKAVDANIDTHHRPQFVMELVDHTTRACDDHRPFLWEAKISKRTRGGTAVMTMVGNPKPVVTPQ